MHEDLDEAIRRIDEAFGAGYAKGHPELVAALVHAAAFDRVAKAITSNPAAGDLARKSPAAGRIGCEADIHIGLLHVEAHRSRDGAESVDCARGAVDL